MKNKITATVMSLSVLLSIIVCTIFGSMTAYADESVISADGIYVAECNRNEVVAGMVVNNPDGAALEYLWTVYNKTAQTTETIQSWTEGSEWITWEPDSYGEYVLICDARLKSNPNMRITAQSEAFWFNPYIKGKCQMPYWGEGGGYLIGVESYENPEQSYYYEMLILDCTLLAEGKDAWVYTTGKYRVDEGNAGWCIWQPQYGYYWTLFRVYDADGEMIDQACYGFANTGEVIDETPTEESTEAETESSTEAPTGDVTEQESTTEDTVEDEASTEETTQGINPCPVALCTLIVINEGGLDEYKSQEYEIYAVWDSNADDGGEMVKSAVDILNMKAAEFIGLDCAVSGNGPTYYGEYDEGIIVKYTLGAQKRETLGTCPYELNVVQQDGTAYYVYHVGINKVPVGFYDYLFKGYQFVNDNEYVGYYDEGAVYYTRLDIAE